MTGRAWNLYVDLMALAVIAGILALMCGFYWPVFNRPMAAHEIGSVFTATPHELRSARLALILFRAERVGYLLAFACAVGAMVVSLRAQRRKA